MSSVVRAVIIYLFLLVVFRIVGRRALHRMTSFDMALLLLIGNAGGALRGTDLSLTNYLTITATLVMTNVFVVFMESKFKKVSQWVSGVPLILIDRGKPLHHHLKKSRVDMEAILSAARTSRGLVSISQIKYAILERGGHISIIPEGE